MDYVKEFSPDKIKYLNLLSKQFPTQQSVCTEIINLSAIENMPKGTEYFMSDIHGEYEAFKHILNNCSGVVREKVDDILGDWITAEELDNLCTLIYYPEQKIEMLKQEGKVNNDWYRQTLYHMILVARKVSGKYTQSKVRKKLPPEFAYIIDELIHVLPGEEHNQIVYHNKIIDTIIELDNVDQFIVVIADLIKNLLLDHLHLVGDLFDRGQFADDIIDMLKGMKQIDIQWGNHDVLWIGAAAGDPACICNVIRNNIRYDNARILESGYAVSLRKLMTFGETHYPDYHWKAAIKAINVLTLKLEGMAIKRHPEWGMDDRLMFEKIKLDPKEYPTIDPDNPYTLTEDEIDVLEDLQQSFRNSVRLKDHINFLIERGSMYLVYNNNLLFHGCLPMTEEGDFYEVNVSGHSYKGKGLMDYCDRMIRKIWYGKRSQNDLDFMWYMWGGVHSPFCGRVLKTWERTFLEDKSTWTEPDDPYYRYSNEESICEKILKEFGIENPISHIINGHTPVKEIKGESPIKANGRLIVIDGGFCKAYHSKTGIAGYTLIYNSHGMRIKAHGNFKDIETAVRENDDIHSRVNLFETELHRQLVRDTDIGKSLANDIDELKLLLEAYRRGLIREIK